MKKQNSLRVALMCGVAGGLLLASCTDSDYDLSKDIDLTMGLGSQGLALKLGSTQNVYLRDFFTVDDSEMLDTLGSGMYYLIQDGQASVPVDVNEIAQTDDIFNVDLNADIDVLSGGTLVPAGDVEAPGVTASEPVQVNLKDIPEEILSIRRISPEDPIEMSIELIVDQPGRAAFGLKEMRDMKIEFPSYIYSSQYEEGTHTISVPDRTFSGDRSFRISGIMADSIVMGGSDAFGQEVVGGTLMTPDDEVENITMSGTFVLANGEEIQLGADERVGIRLSIAISSIRTGEITGQVSPGIEPDIEPIDISSDLPDFLQDESVSLHMTNPTIRFDVQGEGLPVPLLFWGQLDSRKNTASGSESILPAPVRVPMQNTVGIPERENSSFYFYQGDEPFDPSYNARAEKYEVDNLSSLIEKLPDYIDVDLDGGKVSTDLAQLHTIQLPTHESIVLDYQVLVPFRFSGGTQIMYTDSVADMNEDLQDYSADSLFVTGVVENHIPLDLVLTLEPQGLPGFDGERPSLSHLISVNTVDIRAAKSSDVANNAEETSFRIALKMSDPQAVKLLDALEFRVHAASSASGSQELSSRQYMKIKDLRLRLGGQIVGDFNDDDDE